MTNSVDRKSSAVPARGVAEPRSRRRTMSEVAAQYIEGGLRLVSLRGKQPTERQWSDAGAGITNAADLRGPGIGIHHLDSRTCAVDVDQYDKAGAWLRDRGIDLDALLQGDDAVQIDSGRPGRAKLLYRLPEGLEPPFTGKIPDERGKVILEFRCATRHGTSSQDVLPPSVHPDTQRPYRWAGKGHWRRLPVIPSALLEIWSRSDQSPSRERAVEPSAGGSDVQRARLSLACLSPAPRDQWISVGMHLRSALGAAGFELWHEWSARVDAGEAYRGEEDCRRTWETLNPSSYDGLGALQRMAEATVGAALPNFLAQEFPLQEQPRVDDFLAGRFTPSAVPEDDLPARDWLVPRLLLRGVTTVLAGTGGVAKSMYALTTAVALASGRDLLGQGVRRRHRVYLLNNEDPRDELARRLLAICAVYQLNRSDLDGWLEFHSGYSYPLRLVSKNGAKTGDGERLEQDLAGYDLLIVDPLLSAHSADENSNEEMERVMGVFRALAGRCHLAVLLLHHLRKGSVEPGDVDASRGASAVMNAARIGATLHHAPKHATEYAYLPTDELPSLRILVFGKENLSPANRDAIWYKLQSTALRNSDRVGVPVPFPIGYLRETARQDEEARRLAAILRCMDEDTMSLKDLLRAYQESMGIGATQARQHITRAIPLEKDNAVTVEVGSQSYRVWRTKGGAGRTAPVSVHREEFDGFLGLPTPDKPASAALKG